MNKAVEFHPRVMIQAWWRE